MCKQCVTFAQNKRSNVWQRAHLCEIVPVRIAQLVHASRHAVAHNMRNVVVLSGCEPLKMALLQSFVRQFCGQVSVWHYVHHTNVHHIANKKQISIKMYIHRLEKSNQCFCEVDQPSAIWHGKNVDYPLAEVRTTPLTPFVCLCFVDTYVSCCY